jgi:hypothetical protein
MQNKILTKRKGAKKMNNEKNTEKYGLAAGNEEKSSARIRIVRFVYGFLTAGYLVCVILQVFFAGLGIFVNSNNLELHRTFANYFEFASIIIFLLSFAGRIKGSLRWLPLGLFVLTSLQHMTIQFPGFLPAIHTIDALLLFWISMHLTKHSLSWLLLRTRE